MPLEGPWGGEVFDYVVVGSGSAGGVIASRLSESGHYKVLCLEAGTQTENYIWTRSPLGGAFMIHNPKVNWNDFSEPNESHGNRAIHVPHGKILGGSSAINGTVVNRGQHRDYDTWAQMGCRGWGYQDVLPYFKKLESTEIGGSDLRGRDGPIKVTYAAKLTPFYDLFIKSAQSIGLPYNPDYLGATQEGVAMAQMAVLRGKRNSTATQYLAPARARKNLTILSGAEAASLILNGKTCVGIRVRYRDQLIEIRPKREVIVSCGTINSPKLLELSGIGNPEVLARHGIGVVQELRGVGENLRDHYGPTLKWRLNKPGISICEQGRGWRLGREILRYLISGGGFIGQTIGTMRVFARSHQGIEDADIQLIGSPFLIDIEGGAGMSGTKGRRKMSPVNGFFLASQVQRPESTGNIHIKSADPFRPPAINYKFLATENDRRVAVAAVRCARRIVAASPLADVIDAEISPGPQVESDDQILDYIHQTGQTTYHPVGTCKMGHEPMAVVDDRLRVHGISNLRVADASIMPTIVSGNTSIPAMMIGEKAAAMILEDAAR